jgi:hypothetical protein
VCGRAEAEPSRAERAFDQVERSIANEYTVETELPRQHCRGCPKDRVPRVPLRAKVLYSGTASRAPVKRRPKMMGCTRRIRSTKANGATAGRWSDSDSDSDGPLRNPDEILRTASSCRRVRRRILLSARRPSRDEKAKCAREQPTREVGSALVGVRGMKAPRPLAARWSQVGGQVQIRGFLV